MQIYKIHQMTWANSDKTQVVLIADTNTGEREEISTPYNEMSIIWDAVRAFPAMGIKPYVAPVMIEVADEVIDV